ncbi:hypothetical protein PUNSTDRAFT_133205 [Punctularia strigosozonata HHB-11173 SS5]|uniref:uncharacterized protein n=1 Tax=Punctularia strigosozonata (strain HHB-11173) TaxID=741275 RepID=UPI0004417678|nr:uncharacterized protein PUNSTDRAFT_133205 [Punctularia strigosozonata HHB-11173 SS5]EIN09415.1 hypothetical protein PUNSTDRAFT_133205 [Punctularia strigosozonata HHB-11173 SS5]
MALPQYSTFFNLGLSATSAGRDDHFAPRPNADKYLSFLSLDLAEPATAFVPSRVSRRDSQVLPLPHKRRASYDSDVLGARPSSHLGPPPPYSPGPSSESRATLVPSRSPSLRAVPSPKPAPSSPLPSWPSPSQVPPLTLSSVWENSSSESDSDQEDDVVYSMPATQRHSSRPSRNTVPRPVSGMTWSTVASPRRRHASRSEALALLEGRGRLNNLVRTRSSKQRSNFMNMSDDEADDEHDEAETDPAADTKVPALSRIFTPEISLSFPVTPGYLDKDSSPAQARTKKPRHRSRRSTRGQKLPLLLPKGLNFMDLNADVDEDTASFVLDLGAWLSDDASIAAQ